MKKVLLLLSVAAATTFGLSSCDKLEDALFKPFQSPLNFEVTIPVVTNTTTESAMGETVVRYNLDSVIKKNTGDVFGADIIGHMYVNQLGIQLLDNDANNNLSNFEYIKMSFAQGSGTPVVLGPFNIAAGSTANATWPINPTVDVLPYFRGSNVTFKLSGKAKTATTKELRARVSATISFEK